RKDAFEYHVEVVPDPNGRAGLVVIQPQNTEQALTLEAAMVEAHRRLPRDAQPPNPQPEGNDQFVVERFMSQSLGQVFAPESFGSAQAGQFMVVYARDPGQAARIMRVVIGPGNDPNVLLNAR